MLAEDQLVKAFPDDQAAVSLFGGTWASAVPADGVVSGTMPLFDDPRVDWLLDGIGPLDGMRALELGPLEAGHTSMLLGRGVASVLAVEANLSAFLRCLVVKNLLDLSRAKFVLGNFELLLAERARRYDLVLASGVLYHLVDPLKLLQDLAAATDRVLIWSQFYDREGLRGAFGGADPFTGRSWQRSIGDDALTYHEHDYGRSRRSRLFLGGVGASSVWLELDEVVAFFERHGYRVEVGHRLPTSPTGPSACLRALR